jgi:hypothetical protein
VPAAQGRLQEVNYAGMQQVSRKFMPKKNYIIFIVTIAILPHLFPQKRQGFPERAGSAATVLQP